MGVANLGSATPADESVAATGVSFFTEGCAVGALGSSPPFLDSASGFETPIAGDRAADDGSWDCAASFGFNRLNSKLLVFPSL
jgi:hypothetical protein